jgi:cysteinyl-tRNA synthetase
MTLKIYNSLTNKKQEFKSLEEGRVGMYACGVTVYDQCHIGHARGAFVFDVIRKYFKYKGYEVKFVRNITDVDDKIINKARDLTKQAKKKGKEKDLKTAVKEITKEYIDKYYKDMDALGIERADVEPRATEHIDEMIKVIEDLRNKGYAYQQEGDVYFEIKKFKSYGKLSNQAIEQLRQGVRKKTDEKKKDPLDFALWKEAKEDEPKWKSPFSEGRPGWHIECSVMSTKYLGPTFDIHGGGRDLIFPHHENEIAQAESYSGKPFANFWIHNELLTIEGEKMAKSLGNFISISDILKKYHPEVLKLFFLSSHYGSPLDFSFKMMEEASAKRERFYILFNRIDEVRKEAQAIQPKPRTPQTVKVANKLKNYLKETEKQREAFIEAMDDDFNTPGGLSCLYEILNLANKFISDENIPLDKKSVILNSMELTLVELGHILGLFYRDEKKEEEEDMELLNKVVEAVIEIREKARKDKNFEMADLIRKKLADSGVVLEDKEGKTTWRKK